MAERILTGAGAAYNLALGFIPDRVEVWMYNATPDSIVRIQWFLSLIHISEPTRPY